jgi:hypothetical protein
VDHYRASYGRRSQDHPRQCVFFGTTNSDAYLGDETGNRRYWPSAVGAIKLDELRRDRDKLWAEAVAAYHAGTAWHLDKKDETLAAEVQAERRIIDPWEEPLLEWAKKRAGVTVDGALEALGVPKDRYSQTDANRVARILKANGWKHEQVRRDGRRVRIYSLPERPKPRVVFPEEPVTGPSRVDPRQPVTENPNKNSGVTAVTGINAKHEQQGKGDEGDRDSVVGFKENGRDSRDTRDGVENTNLSRQGSNFDTRDSRETRDTPIVCHLCGGLIDPRGPAGWLALHDGTHEHDACAMAAAVRCEEVPA